MLSPGIICLTVVRIPNIRTQPPSFTPCLEKDSIDHQVITTDWDSSTTDSRVAPQTTSRHALKKIMIGFTLES